MSVLQQGEMFLFSVNHPNLVINRENKRKKKKIMLRSKFGSSHSDTKTRHKAGHRHHLHYSKEQQRKCYGDVKTAKSPRQPKWWCYMRSWEYLLSLKEIYWHVKG